MGSRFQALCVDCADPRRLGEFWAEVLEWKLTADDPNDTYIENPEGGPDILFSKVPEGKTVKNRLHMDVSPRDREQDEEVERLIGMGATRVDIGQGDVSWVVMADIEGNEFCVLRTRRP